MPTLADLHPTQTRNLNLLAYGEGAGQEGLVNKATRRLSRNLTPEDIAGLLTEAGPNAADMGADALARRGPIAARRAAEGRTLIGEGYMDSAAGIAKTNTQESIDRGYGSLQERLSSLLGENMTGPATAALGERYLAARDTDLQQASNQIDMNLAMAKSNARSGGLAPQNLIDIGDTEFMLRQLDQQQSQIDAAMKGQLWGSFLGPGAGALMGGITGGTRGALAGYGAGSGGKKSGTDMLPALLKALGIGDTAGSGAGLMAGIL